MTPWQVTRITAGDRPPIRTSFFGNIGAPNAQWPWDTNWIVLCWDMLCNGDWPNELKLFYAGHSGHLSFAMTSGCVPLCSVLWSCYYAEPRNVHFYCTRSCLHGLHGLTAASLLWLMTQIERVDLWLINHDKSVERSLKGLFAATYWCSFSNFQAVPTMWAAW